MLHKEIPYDVTWLESLFLEAAATERRLPPAIIKRKLASWPEYEQSWHAYNAAAFSPKPPKATPKDIDRYFLALDISLAYCSTEQRRLIWAVNYSAELRNGYIRERGPSWEKLSKMSKDRISPKRVKANYLDAIVKLAYRMKMQPERLTQKVITN